MIAGDVVALSDYERYFHQRVDPQIRAYISGPAADGITRHENRSAFERLRLMPTALADLSGANTRVSLFGIEMNTPVMLAPTAYQRLVHPEGELATAKAASLTDTAMVASLFSSVALEEIAQAISSPLMLQLYFQESRDETRALVRRAEAAGCKALMLTVDAPVSGIRNTEWRSGFRLPDGVFAANFEAGPAVSEISMASGSPIFKGMLKNALGWEDVAWLCQESSIPVLLKGILNPLDAEKAIATGAAGVVVSNHAGRVLDGLPATIDALPAVVDMVQGRIPVLVDGGIRRGTDVLKAMALGASAVMVGEPQLHALAVGGVTGVAHMLTILQTELEMAMALTGVASLQNIPPTLVF